MYILRNASAGRKLRVLVAAFRGQPEEGVLRRILSGLPDGSELELQVLSYIVRTYELTPAVLETAARAAKPERWEALMSTVAEAWVREGKAQGRAEGKAQGRAEGKAETLLSSSAAAVRSGSGECSVTGGGRVGGGDRCLARCPA